MRIDHIGYAVKRIERARASMETLGWRFGETIDDTDRNVALAFGELNGYRCELVAPLNLKESSPVDELIAKAGPTPYHICYVSDDLQKDVAELEARRFKVTVPPASAIAFGGRQVVFMYALSVGLIEIVEA